MPAHWPLCHQHKWQPVTWGIGALAVVGSIASIASLLLPPPTVNQIVIQIQSKPQGERADAVSQVAGTKTVFTGSAVVGMPDGAMSAAWIDEEGNQVTGGLTLTFTDEHGNRIFCGFEETWRPKVERLDLERVYRVEGRLEAIEFPEDEPPVIHLEKCRLKPIFDTWLSGLPILFLCAKDLGRFAANEGENVVP